MNNYNQSLKQHFQALGVSKKNKHNNNQRLQFCEIMSNNLLNSVNLFYNIFSMMGINFFLMEKYSFSYENLYPVSTET